MFATNINIFYLIFNWIRTNFFDMNFLETRDTSMGLGTTHPNIGEHNSLKWRAIEKIKEWLFHVALAIFYIMPLTSLPRPLKTRLILALKITVWIFFTSLRSHQNGNRSWKNTMTSAIKTIRFQRVGCVQSFPLTRDWSSILAYGPVFYLSLKMISDFLRLNEAFLKTRTEFYLMFFQAILPTFTSFNNAFQTHEPLIQCLDDKMQASMNK